MIVVRRGKEPNSLLQFRKQYPYAEYEDTPSYVLKDIREQMWEEQNWKKPEFDFSERNDRVTLKLEVGQVVYIPGVADIRNENTDYAEVIAVSKEEKVLAYIRQNGSISMQKVMEIGNYRSRTGARKLIDKMINADLIEKMGEGNKTIYKIKE